ncbi:MAG TPA: hypothetical protein VJN01_12105, partial [Xanthomonadales bacterium]|nr:hypothetical protein [Xanthomonadales bacterium]
EFTPPGMCWRARLNRSWFMLMLWLMLCCLLPLQAGPDFLIRAFYYPESLMLRFHAGHKHGTLRRFAIWAKDRA